MQKLRKSSGTRVGDRRRRRTLDEFLLLITFKPMDPTPGAIGYIELIYALTNHIAFADLKNHDGNWVKASLEGVTAAAAGAAAKMPSDLRVSITDAAGASAYPISSFTYLLIYQQRSNRETGEQVKRFINWALHAGQQYAPPLNYAPLPAQVVELAGKQLETIELPAK